MWFRKNLKEQISKLIESIEKEELQIPEDWQWMDKKKHKLENIEFEDVILLRKLRELHSKGLDIPELSMRIVSKAQQLKEFIHAMESQSGIDSKTQKTELNNLRGLTQEIESIFKKELEYIKESQSSNISEGRIDSVPNKCVAFFSSEANKSESLGRDFNKFLNTIGKKPHVLYKFLRARFSGYVNDGDLIRDYIKGSKRKLLESLKSELLIIEQQAPKIKGVKHSSGAGWNHFEINGGNQQHKGFKAYISVDYKKFTAHAFINAVQELSSSGFKGQIKTCQPELASLFLQQDDNIVIHADDEGFVSRAAQLVAKVLKDKGVPIGGHSRDVEFDVAKDFTVPELPALGIKAHKTSFNMGISEVACEILRQGIVHESQNINSYTDFRIFLKKLFADTTPFHKFFI